MGWLFVLFISLQAVSATVVTETVGQVAEQVVTSREVQVAVMVENILFPSGKELNPKKSPAELRLGQPEFRAAVTMVLLENVVALEAENFNVAALIPEAVNSAVGKVEKVVSGKDYWNEMEVSSVELKRTVTRKLIAKKFLKFKTSSMAGIITDQEVQDYYDKNRVKFGTASFESVRENIKMFLTQQQLEERVRAWFEAIKRKYKVRSFLSA